MEEQRGTNMDYLKESARTLMEAADRLQVAVEIISLFQKTVENLTDRPIPVPGKTDMIMAAQNARDLVRQMANAEVVPVVSWNSKCILTRYS